MPKRQFSLGFDLGGTKLAAALLRDDGVIIEASKIPVHMDRDSSAARTQARVVELIADIAMDFKKRYPKECSSTSFKGIGLVSAGPLNVETGTLIHPANYPGWKIVPLKKMVEARLQESGFRQAVRFQNDAIAASLAEHWIGGAKKLKSFCVVTVGTGIGSGVILNGQPCQSGGMGSEFGHLFIDLKPLAGTEGAPYSVEGVASGTALIRRARSLGFRGTSVEELLLEKNSRYAVLFDEMAQALAILCFNLSLGFHLEKIFFSGGLVKIHKYFLPQTKKHYRRLVREFNPAFECPIEIAKTKSLAGVIGAGYLPFGKG